VENNRGHTVYKKTFGAKGIEKEKNFINARRGPCCGVGGGGGQSVTKGRSNSGLKLGAMSQQGPGEGVRRERKEVLHEKKDGRKKKKKKCQGKERGWVEPFSQAV